MIEVKTFNELDQNCYDLTELLSKSDKYFNPPLSHRVSLEEYAEKLKKEAIIYIGLEEDEVVGITAFYCSPQKYEEAFCTMIISFKRGLGIGDLLVKKMLDHCRLNKMRSIRTQTWEGNTDSLKLFTRNGFRQVETLNNRSNNVRSIILKYDYN